MRFTIRDIIWLTVVMALGVGWWIERRNNAQLRAEVATARDQLDILVGLVRARGFEVILDDGAVGLSVSATLNDP